MRNGTEYDAIMIGSGTGGATIARELARRGKKVLILERGATVPLRESLAGFAAIADEVALGKNRGKQVTTARALTTGGSTAMYFGVAYEPPLDAFRALGVDISSELEEVKAELPIGPLADELVGAQSLRLRDSATALGHTWRKRHMIIDQSRCSSGYSYEAKWKARSYVDEAVSHGATLIDRATVGKVLLENNQAVGVEYRRKKSLLSTEIHRAYGTKIVLAAGELASPHMLRDWGVKEVGNQGFYCNPGYALYGLVPGLQGTSGFIGSMGGVCKEGIELGDASLTQLFLHRQLMLAKLKLRHLFSFPETVGVSVKVTDGFGGELTPDGRFQKQFNEADFAKLRQGEQEATRILQKAGATHIFNFGLLCAGRVGGLIRIGEHVDDKLQTQYRNLYVCDGSIVPESMRGPPTLTLLCLGKYLARHLASAL